MKHLRRPSNGGSIVHPRGRGRARFRAVMMTSFAFIAGLVPLVIATGAGMLSRRGVGTAVFSGMIASACVGIFVIPVLYVIVQSIREKVKGTKAAPAEAAPAPAQPGAGGWGRDGHE
jgi:cytochrome c oxidase assembly factor CtaG